MLTLRNGQCTQDRRLDRVRQIDLRSLDYPVSGILTADQYSRPRSYTWRLGIDPLDQGPDGSCVGHGWAHELAARPGVVTGVTHPFALNLYWDIQRHDPWPGGAYKDASPFYEGTSVLSGAQEIKARGWIDEYRWALNQADLVAALGYHGPVVAGLDWYEGMMNTDSDGYIRPTGDIVGGHCVCFLGVHVVLRKDGTVDPVLSYVLWVNSWGPNWGFRGRGKLALIDLAMLWQTADLVIPVRRHAGAVAA